MVVDRVSFSVAAGEVLGLAGLLGAGRTETLEVLFGLHPEFGRGEVLVNGRRVSLRNPAEAKQHGIALVTEDGKSDGLVLGAGIDRNAELTVMRSISNFGVVSKRDEREVALRTIQQLGIHARARSRSRARSAEVTNRSWSSESGSRRCRKFCSWTSQPEGSTWGQRRTFTA